MANVKTTLANIMIERIEARRAAGDTVAPWRRTWDSAAGMHRNLITGKPYRGSNVFMCMLSGFASPLWVTANQVKKLGGNIRKGESYTPILFWKFPTKEEKAKGKHPFCRFYKVWNSEQVDGIAEAVEKASKGETRTVDPVAEAETIVSGYPGSPELTFGGGVACYVPSTDTVECPTRDSFESAEAYYRTLFHELVHSTGHRNRLARPGVVNPVRFASHDYSEEELVAEMGASMLAGIAGIATDELDENAAAYLDHWLGVLKANPEILVTAGGSAQKAADHIMGITWGEPESD